MYPTSFQDAEMAYRREQLAHSFRAGVSRGGDGTRRRHHLPHRRHDRRA